MNLRGGTAVASALMATFIAAGCTLEPAYERPAPPVPAAYPSGEAYKPAAGNPSTPAAGNPSTLAAGDIGWRNFFADPRLQRLVGLVQRDEGFSVLLTRRADTLRNHTGQVAFPGGRCDRHLEPGVAHPAQDGLIRRPARAGR